MHFCLPGVATENTGTPTFTARQTLDTASEGSALMGPVRKSGEIKYVWIRVGTASGITTPPTIAIETISSGAPSGTDKDASCAEVSFTPSASAWNRIDLTNGGAQSTCTVTAGDMIAVVFRNAGADYGSWQLMYSAYHAQLALEQFNNGSHWTASYAPSTWTVGTYSHNEVPCVLEYSDGSVDIWGAVPHSSQTLRTYASDDGTNAYGNKIVLTDGVTAIGLYAMVAPGGNCTLTLYNSSGTTLKTITIDSSVSATPTTAARLYRMFFSDGDLDLTAGSTYYVMVEPTSTTDISLFEFTPYDPGSNAAVQTWLGGNWLSTYHTVYGDTSPWSVSNTTTSFVPCGLIIDGAPASTTNVTKIGLSELMDGGVF